MVFTFILISLQVLEKQTYQWKRLIIPETLELWQKQLDNQAHYSEVCKCKDAFLLKLWHGPAPLPLPAENVD